MTMTSASTREPTPNGVHAVQADVWVPLRSVALVEAQHLLEDLSVVQIEYLFSGARASSR